MPPATQTKKKETVSDPIPCRTLFPLTPHALSWSILPSIPLLSSLPFRCPTSSSPLLRQRPQHRVLPTRPRPHNLAAANGRVVDERRHLHILRRALPRLVVGREAPRVDPAVLGDGKRVVRAGGDSHHVLEPADGRRREQHARLVLVVPDGVGGGKGLDRVARLVSVDAAPREQLAVGRAGERVVLAAGDVADRLVAERVDELRLEDVAAVGAGLGLDAELGKVVEAPADDAALGVDDERVVRAARELGGLGAARQGADAGRVEGVEVVALEEAAGELGLLAGAPGVDLVFLVEGEDVVGAGGDGADLGELGDQGGSALNLGRAAEAEDALVALERKCQWFVTDDRGREDVLGMCPIRTPVQMWRAQTSRCRSRQSWPTWSPQARRTC